MRTTIEHIDQVTPEWMNSVLKKTGRLERNEVVSIDKIQSRLYGLTSDRYHLELHYSRHVSESLPRRLFIKIGKPDFFDPCKHEVEFYQLFNESRIDLPVTPCYDFACSEQSKAVHLLFEDLSKSHFAPASNAVEFDPNAPNPLTKAQCEKAIECLAAIHSFWWETPRSGEGASQTENEALGQFIKPIEKNLKEGHAKQESVLEPNMISMFDCLGDQLSPARRSIYESVSLSPLDLSLESVKRRMPVTITHVDSHIRNFMFPNDPGKDQTILLDWQNWRVDNSAMDLAYLMAVHWPPGQRRLWEKDLLVHYRQQVLEKGVAEYSWDDCWFGYRFSIIRMLFVPMVFFEMQIPQKIWWPMLKNITAAFQELDCEELLNLPMK